MTREEWGLRDRVADLIRADWPDIGRFRVIGVDEHPLDHSTVYDVRICTGLPCHRECYGTPFEITVGGGK